MTDIEAARPAPPTISRLTALFQRGEVVKLGEDENGPVLVWMNAMTSMQREEAVLDASVAQAVTRQLSGPGSAQYESLRATLEESDRPAIVEALLLNRGTEAWQLGQDDLHADEKWRGERLLLIERLDTAVKAGMKLTDEEQANFVKLNDEYLADWRTKAEARVEEMRAEYNHKETRELIAEHLKAWSDGRALSAQADEYRITQLYYSTRVCNGIEKADGSYDHSACDDHEHFVFPTRAHVRHAEDALLKALIPVADRIDREGGDALGKP